MSEPDLQETIEALTEAAQHGSVFSVGGHGNSFYDLDILRNAITLLKAQQWISVEDEFPEFRKQEELLAWGDHVEMGAYYQNKWQYWNGSWKPFPNQAVTHWMYLPELPEVSDAP